MTHKGVPGYGLWQAPQSLSIIFVHPDSADVESTNKTLSPLWDWISANNGTQAASFGMLFPNLLGSINALVTDVSIAVLTWLGTRLVSRKALATRSEELAQYMLGDRKYTTSSMIVVGGGAVSKPGPESTGLNPQWRKDALISWTFGGGWYDDTHEDQVESIETSVTTLTQELGKIAGLEDAAYFNEADP